MDLKLEKGKFIIAGQGKIGEAGVEVGISVGVDTDLFFDKIAALIPGKIDDAVLAVMKQVCKQV